MNKAPKGKADSSLKSKLTYNTNSQSTNNANNTNNTGQNVNNEKEGEQENEHIIECMNILNEQEEAEQFAITLLEEIIWNAESLLFEKYIEKQIIPFTLNFFENKIMEIIDWNFFKFDNGKIDKDAWCPDIELEPIINDSWARGAIPVKHIPRKKSIPKENDQITISTSKSQTSLSLKKHLSKKISMNKTKKRKENMNDNIDNTNNKRIPSTNKEKSSKINNTKSKKAKNKTIKQNIMNSDIPNDKDSIIKEKQKSYMYKKKNKIGISDIINHKQSTIQVQSINKDGWNIDNIYNYTGRLISTIKSSPDKSFEQSVKAHIIEPIKPKQKPKERKSFTKRLQEKKSSEETIKLSSLYNNDLNDDIEKLQNDIDNINNLIIQKNSLLSETNRALQKKKIPITSQKILQSLKLKKNEKYDKLDPLLNYNKKDINYNYEKYIEDVSLEIPSFINSINIAPGVKLYEGNNFKAGPSLYPNNEDDDNDPKILLLKKGKQKISNNNKDPQINNELLKDIILRTNPSLKTSE
ncbi:hypothetical protein BCR32DRAFT_290093 [Anaeromyces robustus]|uniref:Uncharacterized protein n=1 Tax=Anaeromyces robustus TaxID=1754192 RepID=A0A1Y1XKU2_9FUNG|nr:hypothetical protein BCR32DRAFT_290093 [Anaeromyces robustus]|eukprot:ORX86370.1 hypothetical protein BCR32DRAFT_290093 [Anaeromyces robustus]